MPPVYAPTGSNLVRLALLNTSMENHQQRKLCKQIAIE